MRWDRLAPLCPVSDMHANPISDSGRLTSDENSVRTTFRQVQDLLDRISFLEIDKMLGTHLLREFFSLVTSINHDGSNAHGMSQLDTLDTNTTATTWEDCPLSWFQAGFLDGGVDRGRRAHDRAGNIVRNALQAS